MRTRPTKPFPYLSFFFGGGVWGGAEQKIEKEMVLVGRSPEVRGRWRGCVVVVRAPQGARESTRSVPLPIGDFLQKKFGFRPKGTANLRFCRKRQNCEQSKALQKSRFARKGLNLQRFATLRVGKKKCFGFGFGSSFVQSTKQNKVLQPIFFCFAFGETWK